jgi:hypothetical protein
VPEERAAQAAERRLTTLLHLDAIVSCSCSSDFLAFTFLAFCLVSTGQMSSSEPNLTQTPHLTPSKSHGPSLASKHAQGIASSIDFLPF